MSQKLLNSFNILEEYENIHAKWCADLIANGRQTLQSLCNIIDNDLLVNLMDSFMRFVSLLAQCNTNSLSNEKITCKPKDLNLKQQNESQDLLLKNDIIKVMNSDLQCPICNEWLFKATSANCNHTFCETCIKKWLKINKACPVCRTSIQYTSTSLTVDNFITNLCHLFGGLTKERRESIMNAHIDEKNKKTDVTVDELIVDLNINQSIEDDTFISQVDTTMLHHNMVRLIPCPQTPVSRENSRQPTVSPNIPHPNTVQLLPFPQSSVASVASPRSNRLQPTSSTYVISSRHVNRFQPTTSSSVSSPRVNRLQPTSPLSVISSGIYRYSYENFWFYH
ncbi:PREDICTED: E3 ubiquitin-protein ligase RNF8-B-like [Diuraphis noxia]|uniref:E3 ubiquitin-protein ligase RNF8-B-like n=1 Tax=Diuraphis noxia TaxID=143948 RepID=UPI0007638714|nr:PREDICTED: E3 ubiquitin-protein ligase RNF8-B-like [Diuraphis noxia]